MSEELDKENDLTKDAASTMEASSGEERKPFFQKWWSSVVSFFSKLIAKKRR